MITADSLLRYQSDQYVSSSSRTDSAAIYGVNCRREADGRQLAGTTFTSKPNTYGSVSPPRLIPVRFDL